MSEIGNQMEYIEELKYLKNKEKERKEKARKKAKEHYYKYKEAHLKAQKRWKENNPEKVKEYEKKRYEKRKQLKQENERLENIIKEVREYITSYESISIMQGLMNEYSNYDLDIKTMNEMIRRYMVVHDELLEILDKGSDEISK